MGTLDGQWSYTYDGSGQLIHAVLSSTNLAIPSQDLTYEYDAVGNRVRTIENGVTTDYTTNSLNQYTAAGGTDFAYDADGNVTSRSNGADTATFTYDPLKRLKKVITPTGAWDFEYDLFGNRNATVDNGERREYLLDPSGSVDVVGEYNSVSGLTSHYAYGLGLTAQLTSGGDRMYFDFDAVGSTANITNQAGTLVERYSYDPVRRRTHTKIAVQLIPVCWSVWSDSRRSRRSHIHEGKVL